MLKGGYQIVDLKGVDLSEQGYLFPGLYSKMGHTNEKVVLLANINIDGVDFKDYFVQPVFDVSGVSCTIGDKTLLVTPQDIVSVTDGIIGGGSGGGSTTTESHIFNVNIKIPYANDADFYSAFVEAYENDGRLVIEDLSISDFTVDPLIFDTSVMPRPPRPGYTSTYFSNGRLNLMSTTGKTMFSMMMSIKVVWTSTYCTVSFYSYQSMGSTALFVIDNKMCMPQVLFTVSSDGLTLRNAEISFDFITSLYDIGGDVYTQTTAGDINAVYNGSVSLPTTTGTNETFSDYTINWFNVGDNNGDNNVATPFVVTTYGYGDVIARLLGDKSISIVEGEEDGSYTKTTTVRFSGQTVYAQTHLYAIDATFQKVETYTDYEVTATSYTQHTVTFTCLI